MGLVGGGAVVGAYWWVKIRPRLQVISGEAPAMKPSRVRSADVDEGAIGEADRTIEIDGEPMGLAWDGRALIAGLRKGGVLRFTTTAEGFDVQSIPLLEPKYDQNVSVSSLTSNGREIVGLAMGSWLGARSPLVFTIHDPATLELVRHVPAPDGIGAVAWDGSGYWVATRKNTTSEEGPAVLQRLDTKFQPVKTFEAPAVGCQGLAWDGERLWWADVFDGDVLQLDVSGEALVVVSRHPVSVSYLSGLAWDGRHLWISEYAENRLHRISSRQLSTWSGRPEATSDAESPEPARTDVVVPASGAEVEALLAKVREGSFDTTSAAVSLKEAGHGEEVRDILREKLWSDDSSQRSHAESALEAMGLPIDRARHVPSFAPETGPEDTDLLDLRVWIEDDEIHASWRVHVGEDLFGAAPESSDGVVSMPTFARYEVSVDGGTIGEDDVTKEYDAQPGENAMDDEVLASGVGPGKYDVSVFIHVQYVTPEGGNKILNDSAGWLSVEK